jgi:heme/copper-type cytochrome/quinol oxidase subunit 3
MSDVAMTPASSSSSPEGQPFSLWRNPTTQLVLLFILSEATFFVFLIIAYIYFHVYVKQMAIDARVLDAVKTGVFSIFLFSSSGTAWLAERALKQGSKNGFCGWLAVTICLGLVFLVGQAMEYAHLLSENVTVSKSVFGTAFFTLTGFHGFHVFIGLVALTVILILGLDNEFSEPHEPAVLGVSLYWHFVDVVWVFIFAIIYLGVV